MKDQFVIACLEKPADAETVIPWARHFAERLNHKGLMVLHVSPQRADDRWLHELGLPFASLVGDWRTAIAGLATAFNGILAVTTVDTSAPRASLTHPSRLLREFHECKIAYLCIPPHSPLPTPHAPLSALLTLTHQREGKEKLVWASYLARFLGSSITVATPAYRDSGLRQRLANNLRFADKVFTPLGMAYATASIPAASHPDRAALALAPGLLIARTTDTRERDLLDWLLPLPEMRLLRHTPALPILFLNPRDDLYILCD